jgi:hypothetical protein
VLGGVYTGEAEVWVLAFETERTLFTLKGSKNGRIVRVNGEKMIVGEIQEKCAEEVRNKEAKGLYFSVLYQHRFVPGAPVVTMRR